MDTNCPHCNSGATQAVGMTVLTGTRSWAGNHVSTGFRGNPRVGASWGRSQSALAASLDPGPRPSYLTVAAGVLLAYSVLTFMIAPEVTGWGQTVVGILGLGIAPIAFLRRRAARQAWTQRVTALLGAWVCRKCGEVWHPCA